jgi:colicin import membrane protein
MKVRALDGTIRHNGQPVPKGGEFDIADAKQVDALLALKAVEVVIETAEEVAAKTEAEAAAQAEAEAKAKAEAEAEAQAKAEAEAAAKAKTAAKK